MRSPVIAFGILAATVSPTLIAAAPTSPNVPGVAAVSSTASGASPNTVPHVPAAPGVPSAPGIPNGSSPLGFFSSMASHRKRADDSNTAGGNARTGNTNSANGGSVVNNADPGTDLTSDDSSKFPHCALEYSTHFFAQTSVVTLTTVFLVTPRVERVKAEAQVVMPILVTVAWQEEDPSSTLQGVLTARMAQVSTEISSPLHTQHLFCRCSRLRRYIRNWRCLRW